MRAAFLSPLDYIATVVHSANSKICGNLRSDRPPAGLTAEYPPPYSCVRRLVARGLPGLKLAYSDYDTWNPTFSGIQR